MASVHLLTPHPDNPRHGDVAVIGESVRENGFYGVLIVQRSTGHVLAGTHRLLAAREQGLTTVPVVWLDVDDDRARRILLADNRSSDLATYDESALAELLAELDGDYAGSGYAEADMSALLGELREPANLADLPDDEQAGDLVEAEDSVIPPPATPVTVAGDVWLLGPHRVLCGDCRDADAVTRLLGGAAVNLAFTSPPYASRRKYDGSSGFTPIRPDEYVDWFEAVQANVREHLTGDGSWFVNIKEHVEDGQRSLYVKDLTIAHVRRWGWRFVDELMWNKLDPFPGAYPDRFKNAFEPIFHFSAQEPKHRPEHVLAPSDSAIVPGSNTHRAKPTATVNERFEVTTTSGLSRPSNVIALGSGAGNVEGHPAAYPAKLPAWFIRAYTDPGDVVFDPFAGSGSTLVAAHHEQRTAYGMEISPGYVDVICRRFQMLTGELPVLEATGEPHDFTD